LAVRSHIRRILLAIIVFSIALSSAYAQTVGPADDWSAVLISALQAPAASTAKSGPKSAKQKKPSVTRTIETQLSGFTSEDADQLYARLRLEEKSARKSWYVRGLFSRTATKHSSRKVHVTTQKLDSRLERVTAPQRYTVWTGVLSRRDRDYAIKTYPRRSGYHFLSYGFGKQLDAKTKGDIGLGVLEIYDENDGTKPALVLSIRGKRPLSKNVTFDGDILAFQPTDRLRSTKVDSDLGLSYKLGEGLSLRLSWSATNLIRPVRSSREWDSVVRLSVSFRRTTTR